MSPSRVFAFLCGLVIVASSASAQITRVDYERANSVRQKFEGLLVDAPESFNFIDGDRLWYRKSVPGGNQFVLVDIEAGQKRAAFDHGRLAEKLSAASGEDYTAVTLPFRSIEFLGGDRSIQFTAAGFLWTCDLSDYTCERGGPGGRGRRGRRGGEPAPFVNPYEAPYEEPREFDNDVFDGIVQLTPQGFQGRRGGAAADTARRSPDGRREAYIQNFNIFLRAPEGGPGEPLSRDGSAGNYYTLRSITWSPDSVHLTGYRVRPGYERLVHYIESSPRDQRQPVHSARSYTKPGDALDVAQPVLFNAETGQQIDIDDELFPNPYSMSNPVWREDGRAFTFEYNQRGHEVYRVIEVDAASGRPRAVISEVPETFFNYRPLRDNPRDTGHKYRYDLDDGREIIWMSEGDGWGHLYLYDGITGEVKNQITRGEWVVRAVDRIDEEARQIWFQASGMNQNQDPYFRHYYRIDFEGANLVALTDADGDHRITFSDNREYYVDTWSRVDLPPVSQLRRTEDREVVMDLEAGDMSDLLAAGWRPPEVFMAKGRDGTTDIWGIIHRPTGFDPSVIYPVIESIYAGPQGSFVPKTFRVTTQPLAELGFIVSQIDGMGTNNRSKAFHDVAWQNLGDAGLPDRILWHEAVAAKYPYYDISRVGIYGGSAGGQNALGALLFHPEFYKAAAANCGCHDNRMDKIWWNEQWMGWPLGDHYSRSSNVDNAHRLQGALLLAVGEMDTNVDPASTMQVVDALIRSDKNFDLLVVPGGGHGAGGAYYRRMLNDFFVEELLGQDPPDWNNTEDVAEPDGRRHQ